MYTSIHLNPLGISILILAFCPDKEQLPSVMADVIMLLFKDSISHVVILSDIVLICSGLPFLMVLKHDVASDRVTIQIQKDLFTAVAAVSSNCLQGISKRVPMLIQNRDQRMVVCPVMAHKTMEKERILYRNLEMECRL